MNEPDKKNFTDKKNSHKNTDDEKPNFTDQQLKIYDEKKQKFTADEDSVKNNFENKGLNGSEVKQIDDESFNEIEFELDQEQIADQKTNKKRAKSEKKPEAETIKFFKKPNKYARRNTLNYKKNDESQKNIDLSDPDGEKEVEYQSLTKQRIRRMANVSIIYSWQLFDENIDIDEVKEKYFELSIEQLKLLNFIQKNYTFLKKIISLQLKSNWSWERILPLIRSILLVGAAELFFIPPRIVFNEAIEITKIFSVAGDNEFCFVNAVLQKIYDYYETKNLLRN